MKGKLFFVSFIAGFLVFAGFLAVNTPSVSAQQNQDRPRLQDRWGPGGTSELYYVNVPIEKIYPSRKGYVVVFRRGVDDVGRTYVPYEWFLADSRKAELIQLGDGPTWPCMSIFYKEGAFHSVRLYVSKRLSHMTWGNLPADVNLDKNFEGVESIDLGFKKGQ